MATINAKKVVLVTGGSSGLGKATCEHLAALGHTVYGTARDPEQVEGHTLLRMDVTDAESIAAAVARIRADAGRLDVVVNNAGRGIQGPTEDITSEQAIQLFNINLFGVHRVCQAVLPVMREQGHGTIINISSISANFGLPFRGFYSASKAAVDRYSETLRMEVASFGIDVVVVQPGEFKTNTDANRIKATTISEPYRSRYERTMELLSSSLHYSRDPRELAQVIGTVVSSRTPKNLYRVAVGQQRLSVLAKRILPARLFERLLMKHFE